MLVLGQLVALARQADHHLREFVKPFNQLLKRYASFPLDGGYLLAEQPLRGRQVTVEGCVFRGEGMIVGITDSIMYPGTISFRRFDYPSSLQSDVQERMGDLALRFIRSIGFDDGLFNVEMFYDPESDAIHIIEINPRMSPQFADLMEKVNGVNTYEIALAIAAGVRPRIHRPSPQYRVAASCVMRLFEDKKVARVPSPEEVAAFQARFPDARLKVLCREEHHLSDELQDGRSYRYAILNLGGQSARDLAVRYARRSATCALNSHPQVNPHPDEPRGASRPLRLHTADRKRGRCGRAGMLKVRARIDAHGYAATPSCPEPAPGSAANASSIPSFCCSSPSSASFPPDPSSSRLGPAFSCPACWTVAAPVGAPARTPQQRKLLQALAPPHLS